MDTSHVLARPLWVARTVRWCVSTHIAAHDPETAGLGAGVRRTGGKLEGVGVVGRRRWGDGGTRDNAALSFEEMLGQSGVKLSDMIERCSRTI